MTRDEARKAAEVMLAYADGKEIEKNDEVHDWFPAENKKGGVDFQWQDYHYRIKPEPKYRPFKDAEECWQEMQKHQPFGWVKDWQGFVQIQSVWTDRDPVPEEEEEEEGEGDLHISIYAEEFEWPDGIFKKFTFADGTPFGVKEGEI